MELKIEYIAVEDLKPYEKNNKKHEDFDIGEIAKSISKYEMIDPVGIWGKDNTIVEGHGRVLACKQLGIDKVPCIRLDHLTDEQRREYAIVHNKSQELALYDFDNLADELADLDLSDFDFDFGIDTEAEEQTEIVEDEAPEVDEENEPITKFGDIWQLGRHRLMCGDSTDKETVELLMNGNKADLLLTDPPYGINADKGVSGFGNTKGNKYDDDWDSFTPDKSFFDMILEMPKNAIIFGGNYFTDKLPLGKHWIVWDKVGEIDFQNPYSDCELAWSNISKESVKKYTVIQQGFVAEEKEKRVHPTQKSVKLFAQIIDDYTDKGNIILDTFCGSGTTFIASEQTDRVCYGIEISEKYCDVIIKRWETLTGEKAVKLN
ncbi:MAG: site-specific DNA-methyltransferase [Clostridia bacterium]|nr:site-specific DNA-methyltransferase [Clostridia bacterium]